MSDTERETLMTLLAKSNRSNLSPAALAAETATWGWAADAILASAWLAAHDAKVRAEEREKIAAAIEVHRSGHYVAGWHDAIRACARIAREGGES